MQGYKWQKVCSIEGLTVNVLWALAASGTPNNRPRSSLSIVELESYHMVMLCTCVCSKSDSQVPVFCTDKCAELTEYL